MTSHREDTSLLETPRHSHQQPHGHGVPAPYGERVHLRPPCLQGIRCKMPLLDSEEEKDGPFFARG